MELTEKLRRAFTEPAPAIVMRSRSLDALECLEVFGGKDWWNVDLDHVMHAGSCFTFLSVESNKYYLPCYFQALAALPDHSYFIDLAERVLSYLHPEVPIVAELITEWSSVQIEVFRDLLTWIKVIHDGALAEEVAPIEDFLDGRARTQDRVVAD